MLEAAATLFHEVGYDAARIEDIAERAGVSVGTFYNYFEAKGDILVATVAMEVEEVLEQGAQVVANPPADVALALKTLIAVYYDHSLTYLSKKLWRTAIALVIDQPEAHFSRVFTDQDTLLCQQVAALLLRLQADGAVRRDVDVAALAEMIFNNLNAVFIDYVKYDAMSLEALTETVARQNAPLAQLIRSQP